uniref:Uncharacterized protein n=1 Tax=Chlamydomonas euryale TaxID=1486919 RepID=A0A7R9VYG7_9CHLO
MKDFKGEDACLRRCGRAGGHVCACARGWMMYACMHMHVLRAYMHVYAGPGTCMQQPSMRMMYSHAGAHACMQATSQSYMRALTCRPPGACKRQTNMRMHARTCRRPAHACDSQKPRKAPGPCKREGMDDCE